MTWFILARAVAGVGGGGIVSLVWTITSEIVDVQNQAKWSQALSITWACSAVAGPLLGGLFSSKWPLLITHGDPGFPGVLCFASCPGQSLTELLDTDETGPLNWRWACEHRL